MNMQTAAKVFLFQTLHANGNAQIMPTSKQYCMEMLGCKHLHMINFGLLWFESTLATPVLRITIKQLCREMKAVPKYIFTKPTNIHCNSIHVNAFYPPAQFSVKDADKNKTRNNSDANLMSSTYKYYYNGTFYWRK